MNDVNAKVVIESIVFSAIGYFRNHNGVCIRAKCFLYLLHTDYLEGT